LYAGDFANATIDKIFSKEKMQTAKTLSADYFSSAVLMNKGNLKFTVEALPWEAQLSTLRDAVVVDANGDNLPDILLGGNYYDNNIQLGRYDADFGTILVNKGGGKFECQPLNGIAIKGQVRHIKPIKIGRKDAFVLAKNNDSLRVIRFK